LPQIRLPLLSSDDNSPGQWRSSSALQGSKTCLRSVLSDKNHALLDLIIERQPQSLAELERLSGRAKSNLSRTLRSMERFGLVDLVKGEGGALQPRVPYDEIQPDLHMGRLRGPAASPVHR
jgi:predicted transcriptional regulator